MSNVWGDSTTKFFFELTPEKILSAVEHLGFRCTGRSLALNSMENRVYEVEIELDANIKVKSPSERFRIVKFYRPGRWTKEQILEEHQFFFFFMEYEILVVAPIVSENGDTLHVVPEAGIFYAVFPKVGGRSPDELDTEQLARVGRLLARLHNVGAIKQAKHRLQINCNTYGKRNLNLLQELKVLPNEIADEYSDIVEKIIEISTPLFADIATHRIHGDCHLGNLLWGQEGPFFVDFDDMLIGPAVQDVWLLVPGRDEETRLKRLTMLEAYETMRPFNYSSLRLIEPLRALRFVHFSAWISARWQDPSFPRNFPQFGTSRYWQEQLLDLREQLQIITHANH